MPRPGYTMTILTNLHINGVCKFRVEWPVTDSTGSYVRGVEQWGDPYPYIEGGLYTVSMAPGVEIPPYYTIVL